MPRLAFLGSISNLTLIAGISAVVLPLACRQMSRVWGVGLLCRQLNALGESLVFHDEALNAVG